MFEDVTIRKVRPPKIKKMILNGLLLEQQLKAELFKGCANQSKSLVYTNLMLLTISSATSLLLSGKNSLANMAPTAFVSEP